MPNIRYLVTTKSIVVTIDASKYVLPPSDPHYKAVLEAIKAGKKESLSSILAPKTWKKVCDGVEMDGDGVFHIDRVAIPSGMQVVVQSFIDMKLPVAPLVAFTRRLLRNPSLRSREMLYKFLEHNGHPITDDGKFIAYKKVRKDFKDIHTGKFDNSVGQSLRVPREEVDDDPNQTCSRGLHICAWEYLGNFGDGDDPVVEVEVDPEDVVAVPNDYNGTKMRVCAYVVVSQVNAPTNDKLRTKSQPTTVTVDDEDGEEEVEAKTCDGGNSACVCDDCDGCDGCDDEDDDWDEDDSPSDTVDDEEELEDEEEDSATNTVRTIVVGREAVFVARSKNEINKKGTVTIKKLGITEELNPYEIVHIHVKKTKKARNTVTLVGHVKPEGNQLYVAWSDTLGECGQGDAAATVFVEDVVLTGEFKD
jgi:hypothetical protein